jgi:plastocyanin
VRTIVGLAALALLASACSGPSTAAGGATTGGAQGITVDMTDANVFQPNSLTVPKGATVTWNNTGSAVHTVTDDPSKAINRSNAQLPEGVQPWDSGNVNGRQSYSYTFTTAGTYKYFCIPHEVLGMVGTVTVTD